MKDLQSLVSHPSVQGANMVVLNSGKPIILVRGGDRNGLGQPLSNQHIMGLLKASLPAEEVAWFHWGKQNKQELTVGDERFPINIALKEDKTFHVEIQLITPRSTSMDTLHPGEAVSEPEELDENVMEELVVQLTRGERLALIYFQDFQTADTVEKAVSELGYQPRKTNQAAAAIEVLKYHPYPILVLELNEGYRRDPVYANLIEMCMDERRTMYSLLITPGMKTGDIMRAFSLSVHSVMAPEDTPKLVDHLKSGMAAWERYCHSYHEFLENAGRL